MALSRSISGGMHEDVDLVNYGSMPARFNLEIAIRSDFADLFEVKSGKVVRRGRITTEWCGRQSTLRTSYRNRDFCREVAVRIQRSGSLPSFANGRLTFDIELEPRATWHACLLYEFSNGNACFAAPAHCIGDFQSSEAGHRLTKWQSAVATIHTSNKEFYRFFRQALDDMAALRLPETVGNDELQFVPAAGVPWFVALFGRDCLVATLQNVLVYPGFTRGVLEALGKTQARERDDYRDAEPGKIMHELRRGELAHFKLIPHTPYYGTADATILYLIVLHSTWRCLGDLALLRRHLDTAERCLVGSTNTATATATAFRNMRPVPPQGTRIRVGRTQATRWSIRTARS